VNITKINNSFEKLAGGIIRFRWLIIILFFAITAISVLGVKKIVVESSWDGYFLEDDPMLVQTDKFKEIFGNDYYVAVLTECDSTFSQHSLQIIRELSNDLMDNLSYSDKITSLTDIEFMKGTADGMHIEQIVPEVIPSDKVLLDSIRRKAYSKPNVAKKLISKDGRLTWILVKLRPFPEDSVWQKTSNLSPEYITGEETERIISNPRYASINPKATGMPYLNYRKQTYFQKEGIRVMGLALLLAIFVLALITKSLRGVVVPLLTSIGSIIMVYGFTGFIGYAIDSGMTSIPVLLSFAIAIAYNIHIYSFFRKKFRLHGRRKRAVIETIKEMGWPVFFSALTTMAGLLTFLVIPMRPLRFVGVATSSCVLLSFLIVIFLMPALLSFGKNRKPHLEIAEKGGGWFDRFMSGLGDHILKNSRLVLVIFAIITAICIYGLTKVESAFDVEKTMGRKVPYVNSILNICESELGSMYSYDFMIEFPENDMAKQPVNLKKLDSLSAYVETLPLTKRTTSILDVLKDLNQTLNENEEKYYVVPDNGNYIAQMLLLYENAGGSESQYWVDYDYRRLRLMIELNSYNSGEAEREMKEVQSKARELFPDSKVTAVGSLPQFTAMMQYVVRGQIQSFLMAILIIAFLLAIVFGSMRLGIIGMIPNIAPALVVGGIMGLTGIPLDMMTATLMPMILGLAVDDTIHFINHSHLEFTRDGDYVQSIKHTFSVVGVAIILSTVIISANFLVYTTSDAKEFMHLGFLSVIGMLSALLADLFITPVLIKTFKIFGKEKGKK
jgi:predicted RND superfamily exporter protein